jgi:hypothetical protein
MLVANLLREASVHDSNANVNALFRHWGVWRLGLMRSC